MAVVQHSAITDANLHQPKGASTAAINTTIKSDGAGATSWSKITPPNLTGFTTNGTLGQRIESDGAGGFRFNTTAHGAIYFNNYAAPATINIVSADAYVKIDATTTALGDSLDITEATTARLTYTGTLTRHLRVLASISLDQTSGADRNVAVSVYKNGVLLTQSSVVATTQSGKIATSNIISDTTNAATNDYFELYVKNISGTEDVRVYNMYMTVFTLN